jgi:hypothetical protein
VSVALETDESHWPLPPRKRRTFARMTTGKRLAGRSTEEA